MKPYCMECEDKKKKARLPPDNPMFCTQKCAARWAYAQGSIIKESEHPQSWCETHGVWYVTPWGCNECERGQVMTERGGKVKGRCCPWG